jgi:hypothetical protein
VNVQRNGAKYQILKLIHSERILRVTKAIMKAATVGLTAEYATSGGLKDLQNLEGGLHRIGSMRSAAQSLLKVKFAPRKMLSSLEKTLSKWARGHKGGLLLNWPRDKDLIRIGRPNKPRPGSSCGKIGKTRVIGAKKV